MKLPYKHNLIFASYCSLEILSVLTIHIYLGISYHLPESGTQASFFFLRINFEMIELHLFKNFNRTYVVVFCTLPLNEVKTI